MVGSTDCIVACVLGVLIVSMVVGVLALGIASAVLVFLLVNGGSPRKRRETPFFGEELMILFARLSLQPMSPHPFSKLEELDVETSLEQA